MYPYKLTENPYPSTSTPTLDDAEVLGGTRHKEARKAILSCIHDLQSKITASDAVSYTRANKDFRLITITQDVGSGKTHLALHIKELKEISRDAIVSYVDLSQISPRSIHSLYKALLSGLSREYIVSLRKSIVFFLKSKAERNSYYARKIFGYSFFDMITVKTLNDKAQKFLQNKITPNHFVIDKLLSENNFSSVEISIMKQIIEDKFDSDYYKISTLEDMITSLGALATINLKLLKKLTIFQIDEFDSDKESLNFIKAVINAHLPCSIVMLILTPSSYEEIRGENSSVFDRLEKANYKIDLAGSNTLDEITDILLEYIRHHDKEKHFNVESVKDLEGKIKVIYDEFPDFRNVRSMTNILYHATENAARRNAPIIDESSIDETIKSIYPGIKVRDSIMGIPISEFIKIQRESGDVHLLESGVRHAIRNLLNVAHEMGTVAELDDSSTISANNLKGQGIDLVYNDSLGSKVAISVVINKDHTKSFEQISNTIKSTGFVDKLLILTNANARGHTNGTTIVNIDRSKITDLIYFDRKYKNNKIIDEDLQHAIDLARSIKLC